MSRFCVAVLLISALSLGCGGGNEAPNGVIPPTSNTPISYEWPRSTPEAQGMNGARLSQAAIDGELLGFMYSLLVVRNDSLVFERYYDDSFGRFDAFDIRSVTKSLTSALVGIAVNQGAIPDLDQKMIEYFPEYDTESLDRRKRDITIRHLLMMSAGFDTEVAVYSELSNSQNWVETAINLPLVFTPGTEFRYNSLETHLLSAILTKATGMSTYDFGKKYLFDPLQINIRDWIVDHQGIYSGGSGMFITARNLARFGQLYLNRGRIDANQLLPDDWVEQSVAYQIGGTGNWGDLRDLGYGFCWWVGELGGYETHMAIGYGGQFIMNFTDLRMIVVITSETPAVRSHADEQGQRILALVANEILPAVDD